MNQFNLVCMSSEAKITELKNVGEMKRRRIALQDGRYFIFYTFEQTHDSLLSSSTDAQSQPLPETESAEERNV